MDSNYTDFEYLNDFDSTFHSIWPLSSYGGPYNYYYDNLYNYYPYFAQYRTVPPFYDTTTHRDHFRWKQAPVNSRHRIDDDRPILPPFDGDTTHRTHFPGHYVVNEEFEERDYDSEYSNYYGEKIPFSKTTTHRQDFTPKSIERRSKSLDSSQKLRPRMENKTTHKVDYSEKKVTCPANHLDLRQGQRKNGHIYFTPRKYSSTARH